MRCSAPCVGTTVESDILGWFADLADPQGALWLAYLLVPFVTAGSTGLLRKPQLRAVGADGSGEAKQFGGRSRPAEPAQALAGRFAGVAAVAVVCALTIGLSDAAGFSSEGAIVAAWLITVFGLAVSSLAGEALLAWEVAAVSIRGTRCSARAGSSWGGGRVARSRRGRRCWWC